MGIISFSIKSALTASAVYWTHENRVWGTSHETAALYRRCASDAAPHLASARKQLPFEVPLLPSSGEACFVVQHYWNLGVKNTVYVLHRLPCYAGKAAKSVQDTVRSALDGAQSANKE